MQLRGLQPLSLLDYPGRASSIVFTQGCILRCSFCHNPELIPFQAEGCMDEDVLMDRLIKNKPLVSAVTITGGEPTLQQDIVAFITRLKGEDFAVKLDTSGVRPDVIKELLEKKLIDYIAMDIKNTWDRYALVTGRASEITAQCETTFRTIQDSSVAHEFRTTILPGVHREEDFHEICSYLRDGERYYIQKTSFRKNLDPSIEKNERLDPTKLLRHVKDSYPQLLICMR